VTSLSEYYEQFHRERGKRGTVSFRERVPFIIEHVGRRHDVVELGCRYGDVLSNFVKQNRVVGVDVDREALTECERRFGIRTFNADLNGRLPFDDASFDVTVISEVLEHLPYPLLTLHEISRVLRVGGKVVGSVPNGTKLLNRLRFLFSGIADTDLTHLQLFSAGSLRMLLEKVFKEVEVIPVAGRYRWASKNLFSNYLLFVAHKPPSTQAT
jgi:SAM-dependent methyltransferase